MNVVTRIGALPSMWLLVLVAGATAGDSAPLRGTVFSDSGKPLPRAAVSAYDAEARDRTIDRIVAGKSRTAVADTLTDDAGNFELELPPDRLFELVATAQGFAPRGVEVRGGDDTCSVVVAGASNVAGTVRSASGPVAGARVALLGPRGEELVLATDEKGTFSAPDPLRWASGVLVLADGFAPSRIDLDQRTSVELELEKGTALRGKVVDAKGEGVAGASIRVDDLLLATSSEGGAFSIAHAPTVWSEITARDGNRVARAARAASVLKLTLRDGAAVSGVVTSGGRKLGGVGVTVMTEGGAQSSVTDHTGRYRIAALPPGNAWITTDSASDDSAGKRERLRPGAEASVDLELTRGRRLSGRVTDPEGNGVGGATVMVVPEMPPEFVAMFAAISGMANFPKMPSAVTDNAGTFVLHSSKEGAELIAMHPKWVAGRLKLGKDPAPASLTIRVAAGVQLRGLVHDRAGKPLEGACVTVMPATLGSEAPELDVEIRDTTRPSTQSDGTFVRVVGEGKHHVRVSKPGFVAKTLTNVAASNEGADVDVALEAGSVLTGRLVREGGSAIAGVQISVSSGSYSRASTTAAGGSFRIDGLPPGDALLRAWSNDAMVSLSREVSIPTARSLLLTIPRGSTLRGFVRAEKDGASVEEFTLSISYETDDAMEMGISVSRAVNAADGSFRVDDLPVGTVHLGVSAEGFVASEAMEVVIEEGPPLAPVEIALRCGATVDGTVRDESGNPVDDVMVRVEASADDDAQGPGRFYSMGHEAYATNTTDASGRFTLAAVEPGTRKLAFWKQGYRSRSETLEVTASGGTIDVTLGKGNSLRGQVLNEAGSAVERAFIYATASGEDAGGSATAGADGSFEITGLGAGPFTLTARHDGYSTEEREAVPAGGDPLRIVLRALATGTVFGTVRGLPEESFQARLVSINGDEHGESGPISMDGTYRIEKAPAGPAKASVMIESNRGSWSSPARDITVIANQEQRIDLDVDPGLTVAGRVTRAGRPAAGAHLSFRIIDDEDHSANATAGSDGRYEAQGLAPGRYAVSVDTMGRSSYETSASFAPGNVTLDLEIEGSLLRGRVLERNSGKPIVGANVSLEIDDTELAHTLSGAEARSDAKGAFELRGLAPGNYLARAEHPDYGQSVVAVAIQGTSVQRDFTLERVDGIVVRIVDRLTGSPLSGGIVIVRDAAKRIVFDGDPKIEKDGSYRVPVPPGDYRISVSASDHASQTVRAAGVATITIQLSRGGTLIVESAHAERRAARLIQPDGEEYVLCWCNRIAELRLEGKRTSIEGIAPGSYTLRVFERDGPSRDYPVGIVEGESVSVIVD